MITYLHSRRKKHGPSHFALRGINTQTRDGGAGWWLVFDKSDRPAVLVGAERFLPQYAYHQLLCLRKAPVVGERRHARHIDASLTFFPGTHSNGIPHDQSVDWLQQWRRPGVPPYAVERGYLVVTEVPHQEDYPLEIWESVLRSPQTIDELDSEYRLVWKRPPEED